MSHEHLAIQPPAITFNGDPYRPSVDGADDEEHQPLLAAREEGEHAYLSRPGAEDSSCHFNPCGHCPVYMNIHRIRREIVSMIDDPYSFEQLKAPRMNLAVIRPLVNRLYRQHDISLVYCLLVNRVQFLRDQSSHAHQHTVHITRAHVCELVAIKLLRRLDEENRGGKGLLLLANALVAGFDPFQNAPDEVLQEDDHGVHWNIQKKLRYERKLTTLEVAIISDSKLFLSSPACQKVVMAIYRGQIIYTPSSFLDILPDKYKHKPISLYDPRKAPTLNQYRLIVPRTRNILEVGQFVILLILYIMVMVHRDEPKVVPVYEVVFSIYAFGWILDQFASILEHGWLVYTQNLWSFLDVTFSAIYFAYLFFRLHSMATGHKDTSHIAMDILATGAPVLIPRLAFNLMSENMLFVSLRTMMKHFTILTVLAVWCFAGFLLSMSWLNGGPHQPITVAKWMLWVWFGLDGTGIQRSVDFHWLLGPVLMVTFAFLGNTLFLTILVSMLTNTFAIISSNVDAEIQFRRAVLTFEGVKSDAIFAYQPPFNILALCIMVPLKFILSPRWFHKTNVAAVRFLNLPLLLAITFYERRHLWPGARWKLQATKVYRAGRGRSKFMSLWHWSRFSAHGDIQAVFDLEPPETMMEEQSDSDSVQSPSLEEPEQQPPLELPHGHVHFREAPHHHHKRHSRKNRAGSIMSFDLPDSQTDLLHDAVGIKARLEALEASTKRIEDMIRDMRKS